MSCCSSISGILPNHQSYCDTKAQKIILCALTIIALAGIALVLSSHFKWLPSKFQLIGAGLIATAAYPIIAGILHGIRKCARPAQKTYGLTGVTEALKQTFLLIETNWDKKGTLKRHGNHVYVELKEDFFENVFNAFKVFQENVDGQILQKPLYKPTGANFYVTVIERTEAEDMDNLQAMLKDVGEGTKEISFEIIGYKHVEAPSNEKYVKSYNIIELKSKELESFRKKHGFANKQAPFYVVIGDLRRN